MSMNETDAPADNGVHFERAKEEKKRVLSGRVVVRSSPDLCM